MVSREKLKQIPLFSEFSDEELGEISPFANEVSVDAGKVLVREGDYSYEFMAIEEGTVEVTRNGERVNELGPGDFFGEIGLLEKAMRNATVTATTTLEVITLDGWDMKRLESKLPAAMEKIRAAVEERRPEAG